MNKRLIVQLIMQPDCKLIAIDNSDYNRLGLDMNEHVMVDFLVYDEDQHPFNDTLRIRYNPFQRGYYQSAFNTEYILPKDGTYSYYKLLIPILQHFKTDSNSYANIVGELFYYDKAVYWFDPENLKEGFDEDSEFSLEDVLSMSNVEENCLEWYELVHENFASQTFYLPAKKIFSVCKLNRCLAKLQKSLLGTNNPCKSLGCDFDKYKAQRDMLFGAIYVFDYLKDIGNFKEAQRILDNLQSCNFICNEDLDVNDCGCGNFK